jgi:hypothetical protein
MSRNYEASAAGEPALQNVAVDTCVVCGLRRTHSIERRAEKQSWAGRAGQQYVSCAFCERVAPVAMALYPTAEPP